MTDRNPYAAADARLTRQGAARWRSGHPWLFRNAVEVVEEETGEEPLARVLDPQGRVLGYALLSRESQITLRRLTRGDAPPGRSLFEERIRAAVRFRERVLPGRTALRLVFAESDGLPGLVVDRYGEHLVIQTLSAGMAALQEEMVSVLEETLHPESILARNDPSVRSLEGLPRETAQLRGETPAGIPYGEGELTFLADPWRGQKTGTFLDQVENHALVGRLAHGRVLDAFSYAGGFALAAAGGAEEVVAVDTSRPARKLARENAERNGIENVRFVDANVFDFLKQEDKEGSSYDMVILDPPAFAKNKREIDAALRGYKEINLRAMKILRPGGILVSCSCSYHLGEGLLMEVLARASANVFRSFRVLERTRQSPDHPVLVGFPESLYLKCVVLERID